MPLKGAAIHPNPIYSIAATRCFRWVLTGSEDGYIRKWDFFASMNGKTMLTQVQRHQLVDSITKAGYLASWWENEEQPGIFSFFFLGRGFSLDWK
jgi:transcriptional activator SPT8